MPETPTTIHVEIDQEKIDAVYKAWQDITELIEQWWERMEPRIVKVYLAFEDHGLVEPLYDPASTAGSTDEEWEIFGDGGPAYEEPAPHMRVG